jgi:putative hemolysin
MTDTSHSSDILQVDVEKILHAKNPSLARTIPGFVIRYLRRIVHQDEINEFLKRYGQLKDLEFIDAALKFLRITYTVSGSDNIPGEGRFIFVSNHPLGGLDGLVFIHEVSKYFRDVRFPVNDILTNLENLSGIFLPVNKHGAQAKDAVIRLGDAFASDCQILYFPAGLCSRKKGREIKDLKWHKSFISKAIEYKRDIIPAYFSGRNSDFFYNFSRLRNFLGIKANLEMLYLADEMFNQKGKEINLVFGKRIPFNTFDRARSHTEWAGWVKSRTYELESLIRK